MTNFSNPGENQESPQIKLSLEGSLKFQRFKLSYITNEGHLTEYSLNTGKMEHIETLLTLVRLGLINNQKYERHLSDLNIQTYGKISGTSHSFLTHSRESDKEEVKKVLEEEKTEGPDETILSLKNSLILAQSKNQYITGNGELTEYAQAIEKVSIINTLLQAMKVEIAKEEQYVKVFANMLNLSFSKQPQTSHTFFERSKDSTE